MSHSLISFDGHLVRVNHQQSEAEAATRFLFLDQLAETNADNIEATFEIDQVDETGCWTLHNDDTLNFKGEDINDLANIMMGEVLFNLIANNTSGLAVHAGLVSDQRGAILLPADSGSGKSSVTTWLVRNGMRYHTDELVMINLENHSLQSFTRPLNIKSRGVDAIQGIFDLTSHEQEIRTASTVLMIPHRLINPDYSKDIPALRLLIFPKYIAESNSEIIRLSAAEAGLEMMRSNVIARNLPGHGFGQIINLVRGLPAYRLHYNSFDDLKNLFEQIEADH